MRERLAERAAQFRSKSRPILSNGSVVLVVLLLVASGVAVAQSEFNFVTEWDHTSETTDTPTAVSPNADGNIWVVQYTQDAASPGYLYYPNGTYTGTTSDFPSEPRAVTYNATADEYYVAQFPDTVLILDGNLNQIDSVTNSSMSIPETIHIGPDGLIWVGDSGDNAFYLFGANGTTQGSVSSAVGFSASSGSEYGNDGFTYVSDDGDVYRMSGNATGLTDTGFSAPINGSQGLAETDAGTFYTLSTSMVHAYSGTEDTDGEPTQDDAELELDTRDYIMPNESAPYSVHFNDSGTFTDVTDQATVTSNNTSVLTVNATENLLEGQPGVNTTVNVTAEYTATDGTVYQTTKTITVATATVDNLEILPAIWRFGATLGDDTIFFLIIAMLTGIVGTRLSTAFGGISLYWVVVMIGWFSGWISLGILLVTTAMAVFIGLNLALTIDYGMRPGQG